MTTFNHRFPYRDVEKAFMGQLMDCLEKAGSDDSFYGKWKGPLLTAPVDHICLQPQEVLDKLAYHLEWKDRAKRILWLAFQFGVCQGYAMRGQEHADDQPIRDALEHLKSKLEKLPNAEA